MPGKEIADTLSAWLSVSSCEHVRVTSMCEGLVEWRGAALTCDHAGRLDGAM